MTKVRALGLPPGPWMSQVKLGSPVTLEDGRVVSPEDVVDRLEPNAAFGVIECPDARYAAALLRDGRAAAHFAALRRNGVVFHFTPRDVAALPEYQEWLTLFGDLAEHILLDTRNGLPSALETQCNKQQVCGLAWDMGQVTDVLKDICL